MFSGFISTQSGVGNREEGKTFYIFMFCVCMLSRDDCDPMDCSRPGSSVRGVLQAWMLEWVAISSSRGSSRPGDQTRISCIGRWILLPLSLLGKPICMLGYIFI